MALQSRALTTLVQDLDFIASTHMIALVSEDLTLFWPPEAIGTHEVHRHRQKLIGIK